MCHIGTIPTVAVTVGKRRYGLKPVNDARPARTVEPAPAPDRRRAGRDLAQLMDQMGRLLPAAPAQERLATIRAAR